MKGKIDYVVEGKGYGFIIDEEARQRFFHARDLVVVVGAGRFEPAPSRHWKSLAEEVARRPREVKVEFEPFVAANGGKGNGLRAQRVLVVVGE